jgi:flagellar hook-basal body complex protein FliE
MPAPIGSLGSLGAAELVQRAGAVSKPGEFGKVLEGAIHQIEGARQDANTAIQQFLSGETEELHGTVLAAQRAELAFDLGLQIRNKVVQAYQEIMRMQM